MKLYKCWVEADETQEEMDRLSLEYIREGNAAPGSMQAEAVSTPGQAAAGGGANVANEPTRKKVTPGGVCEKTTEQLAKTAPQRN